MQVSFGVHEDEESAARQYDRALLIEKGRAAKTNFPLPDYEKEAKEFEDFVTGRCVSNTVLYLDSRLTSTLPLIQGYWFELTYRGEVGCSLGTF